jgi:hypothetical protein
VLPYDYARRRRSSGRTLPSSHKRLHASIPLTLKRLQQAVRVLKKHVSPASHSPVISPSSPALRPLSQVLDRSSCPAMPIPAPIGQCSSSSMILRGSALLHSIANSLDDPASRRTSRTSQSECQPRDSGYLATLSPRFTLQCCRHPAKYRRSQRVKRAETSSWDKRSMTEYGPRITRSTFFHRLSCLFMASFCGLMLALAWQTNASPVHTVSQTMSASRN